MNFYWFPGAVTFPRTSDEDMKRYGWNSGPWDAEPDRIYFVDEDTGYDCFIARNSEIGNLCGYVGVPESHPFSGKELGTELWERISIHGGVSYSDSSEDDEVREIPTHSSVVWWIGFGCSELRDLCPNRVINMFGRIRSYKNVKFVWTQVCCLAQQLKEIEEEH